MKVCKRLYFAFLSLGCKNSSQQLQHPQAARGNCSQLFLHFEKKSEKASTGNERPKMTFWTSSELAWARGEPALHWKA